MPGDTDWSLEEIRATFAEWHVTWSARLQRWMAMRAGRQVKLEGPEQMRKRVLFSDDLQVLAEQLVYQAYLDDLSPDELAEEYRRWLASQS